MPKKFKIFVLTGAGISAESGIETFRGTDGLWNGVDITKVAHAKAWADKPNRVNVLDFYNKRRDEINSKSPNKAHYILKELEDNFDVTISTQNVDNLHEKAGSTNIIHVHGQINQSRSTLDPSLIYNCDRIDIGDKCEKGSQLRPNVIFFGEQLDSVDVYLSEVAASDADVCLIIGTSMQVYPAAGLPFKTKDTCLIYYIDPSDVEFNIPVYRKGFFYHIKESASTGLEKVKNELLDIFI